MQKNNILFRMDYSDINDMKNTGYYLWLTFFN